MKSFNSANSGSASSHKNDNKYLKAILTNVFTACGYKHFASFFKRTGKSKLSMQFLINKLQQIFTKEEWYYLRKIHKKENNFFLNKNGKLGEVGTGWVEISSKNSRSGLSTVSQKSGCNSQNSVEESKGMKKKSTKKNRSERTRARSFSDSSNNSRLSVDDHRHNADIVMKMIDEVDEGDAEGSDNSKHEPHELVDVNSSSNHESLNEDLRKDEGFFNGWNIVSDRKDRVRQKQATIDLKDLTESDFLELIDSKNQDKRFFGWLNFQPLF